MTDMQLLSICKSRRSNMQFRDLKKQYDLRNEVKTLKDIHKEYICKK